MDKYEPKNWRSTEQIREYIYVNHHLRFGGISADVQTLVNDTTRTVHEMRLEQKPPLAPTKSYYLSILKRLDDGEVPPLTYESRHYRQRAYQPYAR